MSAQIPVRKIKAVQHLVRAPRGIQLVATFSESQTVKRLVKERPGNDGVGREVQHDDLVLPISGMQHCGPFPRRMHRDVHRKIPHPHLLPGRTKRPLVWQKHGPIRPLPRHVRQRFFGAGKGSNREGEAENGGNAHSRAYGSARCDGKAPRSAGLEIASLGHVKIALPAEIGLALSSAFPTHSIVAEITSFGGHGLLIAFAIFAVVVRIVSTSVAKKPSSKAERPSPKRTSADPGVIWPKEDAIADTPSLKSLSWEDFELLVGEIFRRRGYAVELCAGTGADGGVDLLLRKDEERVLVQCKHWKAQKVGVRELREFFGVLTAEQAPRGIFVTTGAFTDAARDFAKGKPIEMIAGKELEQLLQSAAATPEENLLEISRWANGFIEAATVTLPNCPRCKVAMTKRTSRHGAFWGCSTFPSCRGKRDLRRYCEDAQLSVA